MELQIITKKELEIFKEEMLAEIKKLLEQKEDMPEYVRSKELIKIFKISNTKLHDLRNKGLIPFKKLGGTYLYSINEVKKILK